MTRLVAAVDYKFARSRLSPNFNERWNSKAAYMLVLHYTGMQSAEAALERLCVPDAQVSVHYLVDEQGQIFQLVDEDKRAWHAGVGCWRGETDINSASIGIEIVNPGHEFGYVPFPPEQMQAVIKLSADIVIRHGIKPFNVIGHSDIAPERKEDPGELFDWKSLAEHGVGIWAPAVESGVSDEAGLLSLLSDIGYEVEGLVADKVITAFQRHWRPEFLTGTYDQQAADIAYAVAEQVKRLT